MTIGGPRWPVYAPRIKKILVDLDKSVRILSNSNGIDSFLEEISAECS